jgi:hypothetical protein
MEADDELCELLTWLKLDRSLDPAALRKQVLAARVGAHPNKTGGAFRTTSQQQRYEAADRVLQLLGPKSTKAPGTALQTVEKTQRALVDGQREMMAALEANAKTTAVASAEGRVAAAVKAATDRAYRPTRISLWSAAGAAAFFAVMDKPLGGLLLELAQDEVTAHNIRIWLGLISLLATILAGAATLMESAVNRRVKEATTDYGVRLVLARMLSERGEAEATDAELFSKAELGAAVRVWTKVRDPIVVEATTDTILAKLIALAAIGRTPSKAYSPRFRVDSEYLEGVKTLVVSRPARKAWILRRASASAATSRPALNAKFRSRPERKGATAQDPQPDGRTRSLFRTPFLRKREKPDLKERPAPKRKGLGGALSALLLGWRKSTPDSSDIGLS